MTNSIQDLFKRVTTCDSDLLECSMFSICCTVPFLSPQAIFQLLNLVFQLGESCWGARLALHVSHTTPQLLQLQWQTWTNSRSTIPRIHSCGTKSEKCILADWSLQLLMITNNRCVVRVCTCLSMAFLSSSRSCLEDLSCMSSERSWSIWSLLLATRSVIISALLLSSSSSNSTRFSLSWQRQDEINFFDYSERRLCVLE